MLIKPEQLANIPIMQVTPAQTSQSKEDNLVANENYKVIRTEFVRVSNYTPWVGGTNCSNFVDNVCISKTASGQSWESNVDIGAACPKEWTFGTKFKLPNGKVWVCVDTGGAIHYENDGTAWVDLLTSNPEYPFGEVIIAEIIE